MLGWGSLRLALTAGGPAVCGLLGAPVIAAIGALAAGQVVSYALLYLMCVRAADESDRLVREPTRNHVTRGGSTTPSGSPAES